MIIVEILMGTRISQNIDIRSVITCAPPFILLVVMHTMAVKALTVVALVIEDSHMLRQFNSDRTFDHLHQACNDIIASSVIKIGLQALV